MSKRVKKPAVRPEVRRQWFKRFEEDGESPPQIAKADGYDVRTVRKQIELTRQERETREARAMVLRQALEKHYEDLCAFAQRLESAISWSPRHISFTLREDRMWQALKEHLPKSPIWKATQRWEQLTDQFDLCTKQLEEIVTVVTQERGLKFAQTPGESGLGPGFAESVVFHVVSLARGHRGLKSVAEFTHKRATDAGLHDARMGAYGLGLVHPNEIVKLKSVYFGLLDEAVGWQKSGELQNLVSELSRQSVVLHDELATIRLRRIVSGRCKYCPL